MDPKQVLVVVSLVLTGIALVLASVVGWVAYKERTQIRRAEQLRWLRKRYEVESSEEELRRLVARREKHAHEAESKDVLAEATRY